MATLEFLKWVVLTVLWSVVFVFALIIAAPVSCLLWFRDPKRAYGDCFQSVFFAIMHLFFPSFGH